MKKKGKERTVLILKSYLNFSSKKGNLVFMEESMDIFFLRKFE
jgi:hypothetical protein